MLLFSSFDRSVVVTVQLLVNLTNPPDNLGDFDLTDRSNGGFGRVVQAAVPSLVNAVDADRGTDDASGRSRGAVGVKSAANSRWPQVAIMRPHTVWRSGVSRYQPRTRRTISASRLFCGTTARPPSRIRSTVGLAVSAAAMQPTVNIPP